MSTPRRPFAVPRLYVFFNCEGWIRFGPFELLQFDDSGTILNELGEVLATKSGDEWHSTEKLCETRSVFRNPIVTATPNLPLKIRNSGQGVKRPGESLPPILHVVAYKNGSVPARSDLEV